MVSLNKSRNKPKSTREVQKSQIREAILEALGEKLANGGLHRISVAEIAKKVGISARTVYRYFPSRDELVKALYKWSADKIASDIRNERTMSLETFIARRQELFEHFDRYPNLVKAQLLSGVGSEIRAIGSKKIQGLLDSALAELPATLEPEQATQVKAALYLIFSGEAWQHYRDVWGLNGKQAGETSKWVANLIIAELSKAKIKSPRT